MQWYRRRCAETVESREREKQKGMEDQQAQVFSLSSFFFFVSLFLSVLLLLHPRDEVGRARHCSCRPQVRSSEAREGERARGREGVVGLSEHLGRSTATQRERERERMRFTRVFMAEVYAMTKAIRTPWYAQPTGEEKRGEERERETAEGRAREEERRRVNERGEKRERRRRRRDGRDGAFGRKRRSEENRERRRERERETTTEEPKAEGDEGPRSTDR